MGTLEAAAGDVARRELQSGERLLWGGRPGPLALAASRQHYFWFGLLFLGFSVFWEWGVWSSDGGSRPLFLLWGMPFIACGVWLVLYAPASLWLAHRIVYAVTDRRLMIVHGLPRHRVESFRPADINAFTVTETADGCGSIVFCECVVRGDESNETVRHGFFGIADIGKVASLIDDLRNSAAGGPAAEAAAALPIELPNEIASVLGQREAALWYGRQGRIGNLGGHTFGLAMMILFAAILVQDFSNEGVRGALRFPPALLPCALLIGIVGYGLWTATLPLGLRRDLYILTECRLIILPRPFGRPHSIPLSDITAINRVTRRDGVDDIRFHYLVGRGSDNTKEFVEGGLYGIADGRAVEALLARCLRCA